MLRHWLLIVAIVVAASAVIGILIGRMFPGDDDGGTWPF